MKTKKEKFNAEKAYRHLGVMAEATNNAVQLIVEQYGDIKKTLDDHTKILETHTEMIGSLATHLEIVKEDVEFIKGSLKNKVDTEDFMTLERHVAMLEKKRQ